MDISFINNINESEFISTVCKAKDVAMREINIIYDNWGNYHNGDNCHCEHERHDRMINNLHKAVEVLKDAIYIKAAILGYLGGTTKLSVTRETKPTTGVLTGDRNTMTNIATIS